MIFEWYTGSDATGEVRRALSDLASRGKAIRPRQQFDALQRVLAIEQETNWRGYILWRLASAYNADRQHDKAVPAFLDAERAFDPLLSTIRDVMDAYCDTLYSLILGYYGEREDFAAVARVGMSFVVNAEKAEATSFEKASVLSHLGYAFERLAGQQSNSAFQALALGCYLRWHHLEPDEPRCLEHLMYTYFDIGDPGRSRAVATMCLGLHPGDEARRRVEEFVRTKLPQ